MKKTKLFIAVAVVIVLLVCLFPLPYKLKDGGTTVLTPVTSTYCIYIYNTEIPQEDTIAYQRGFAIELFGLDILDRSYYEKIQN